MMCHAVAFLHMINTKQTSKPLRKDEKVVFRNSRLYVTADKYGELRVYDSKNSYIANIDSNVESAILPLTVTIFKPAFGSAGFRRQKLPEHVDTIEARFELEDWK